MMTPYRAKVNHSAVVFDNGYGDDDEFQPITKYGTTCCSLGILSAKDYHTYDELKQAIDAVKFDSNRKKWSRLDRTGGEQSLVCIISPGEDALEENLKKLNFKCVSDKMKRRKGYPDGLLKMYLLTF